MWLRNGKFNDQTWATSVKRNIIFSNDDDDINSSEM